MSKTEIGQTLIEALLTILLIAVSVIGLIRFQNYLSYNNNYAHQISEAKLIGIKKIETLRDFQVINNTTGYSSYASIVSGTSTASGTNTTYNMTWTVTTYTNPNYKNIDLTVSWTDRYNKAQSIRFITNIAEMDPTYSADII